MLKLLGVTNGNFLGEPIEVVDQRKSDFEVPEKRNTTQIYKIIAIDADNDSSIGKKIIGGQNIVMVEPDHYNYVDFDGRVLAVVKIEKIIAFMEKVK